MEGHENSRAYNAREGGGAQELSSVQCLGGDVQNSQIQVPLELSVLPLLHLVDTPHHPLCGCTAESLRACHPPLLVGRYSPSLRLQCCHPDILRAPHTPHTPPHAPRTPRTPPHAPRAPPHAPCAPPCAPHAPPHAPPRTPPHAPPRAPRTPPHAPRAPLHAQRTCHPPLLVGQYSPSLCCHPDILALLMLLTLLLMLLALLIWDLEFQILIKVSYLGIKSTLFGSYFLFFENIM